MTRVRSQPYVDTSRCDQCQHSQVGASSSIAYCLARETRAFAHQMRQPCAPCGPSAFLFVAAEVGKA